MSPSIPTSISLTSRWFIRPGCEPAAETALRQLAEDVLQREPDTLAYLIHTPYGGDARLQSLPPANPFSVVFFETYRDADAFLRHVNGPVFTGFVRQHGELFVASNGSPFTFVEFLQMRAGFVRTATAAASIAAPQADAVNLHPSVMFEIIAKDQATLKAFYGSVFGWHYQTGTAGFAYIPFQVQTLPLLGGIGQTEPNTPGYEPGKNFYLLVDDLDAAINRALQNGGSRYVDPVSVDGYHFAMIKDPEGNPVGLIKPF
ncbi:MULTISPECIES: VOC family protein [unclassified Cupriavidus]|uniref:VOC family protein n=1 Tax=unclassified Cupriavidus TaxID=2640874 RepID=UPI001AE85871|nr:MULTISPECIES: VOC family protein [unclassified Cupriavidus]MBP0631191.1 antibiotic biosynthesis monooxygenase [Cupriavidus sp. AcVe19-1a]MBP0639292.1 antibiotic biosynthesis monooxygenase [Cupriavidus sp. AcVe19-6a]